VRYNSRSHQSCRAKTFNNDNKKIECRPTDVQAANFN
jgi:hypothetical protein